jgi:hypothetical protein
MFKSVFIQQPQPNDIVGARVLIAGQATGFEATVRARVRDANGHELASTFFMSGDGGGAIGPFQAQIDLPGRPPTSNGFVEVFEDNAAYPDEGPYGGPVAELQKVVVPVIFGSHIVDSYVGFTHYVVVDGDSLSQIAAAEYGDASEWPAIYEANRDRIGDPNLIHSGLHLRIPHYVTTATTTVDVYFVNTVRYAAATEPYLEAVQRSVPTNMPATGALTALFDGPNIAEQAADLAVWRSGATGFADLSISDGIARVRLVGGCDSQGATFTIANLITPTLKQFPTVDHVKIYDPSGNTDTPDGPFDSIPACLNP